MEPRARRDVRRDFVGMLTFLCGVSYLVWVVVTGFVDPVASSDLTSLEVHSIDGGETASDEAAVEKSDDAAEEDGWGSAAAQAAAALVNGDADSSEAENGGWGFDSQ